MKTLGCSSVNKGLNPKDGLQGFVCLHGGAVSSITSLKFRTLGVSLVWILGLLGTSVMGCKSILKEVGKPNHKP